MNVFSLKGNFKEISLILFFVVEGTITHLSLFKICLLRPSVPEKQIYI